MRTTGFTLLALAGLAVVTLSLQGCGDSGLKKAYTSYNAAVTPVLERDMALWKKFTPLFNEQLREESASPERFREYLGKEVVPFYTALPSKVGELAPQDPGVAVAHEILVKYAASRAELVRYVAQNVDLLYPGAGMEALARSQAEAEQAVADYQEAVQGSSIVDPRFGLMKTARDEFTKNCYLPLSQGRISERDAAEKVEAAILPALRKLHAEKFEEDATSQLLKRAIIASEEFYGAFSKNLPILAQQQKFGAGVTRLTAEGDTFLKDFREAMAAIVRRM